MNRFKKALTTLGVAATLALGATALSGTPVAPATPKAEAAYYNGCYVDMFGQAWCYRYGCTTLEVWFSGCYQGWVRVNKSWGA